MCACEFTGCFEQACAAWQLLLAPAEPGRPHERGGGAYISLSDCAAPDVSSCGALLCVFRISDQARTLQYILLAWSAAQQPGSRSGKCVQRLGLGEESTLTYGSLGKCVNACHFNLACLFCFSSGVSKPADVHHVC